MQMACKLVEIYRDANFPLTLLARDILLDYSKVVDIPQDDGTRGGITSRNDAQVTGVKETNVSGGSANSSIRKKRSGWMLVCYHCFSILEEHHNLQHTSYQLYSALGLEQQSGRPELMKGTASDTAQSSTRPTSANKAKRSASAGTLPPHSQPFESRFSTECLRYGKAEPWTRSAFEKYV